MTENHESKSVRRTLDTKRENPSTEVAAIVAELRGQDETDLRAIWNCTEEVLAHLFSDPPSEEAQMVVEFTYEGFRITVEQDGAATFVETE
ncbi:HalOD1 output domain-containing protein [Haloarcula amylovorans]|uniref:HalOD1 output domain-containing protein n=1 Tax=Haloarcula amylovorans TaxID=2562280 RepID=UPI0010761064